MTTYVYETIPTDQNAEPNYYELQQSTEDAPLTEHPETGEPIRRVVLGDLGSLTKKEADGDCGPGCCC